MKLTLLTLVIMVTALTVYGQASKKYLRFKNKMNYREGYIIISDSSKVEGLIKENLMNEAKKFSAVTFVTEDGIKSKYYPRNIRGFGYSIYKFVSDNSSFYQVVHKGNKVSLYKKAFVGMWSAPNPTGMGPMTHTHSTAWENFYVKKPHETTFTYVQKKRFEEEFAEYFGDCESVKQQILNKELIYKDIKAIVRSYNYCK